MGIFGKQVKDIARVVFSNFAKLLAGLLVAFLLPKIVGVADYGYYKTFTLYATYVGLLHFGFVDGIYLKYGGKNYEELDKSLFRFFTCFLMVLELLVSSILLLVSLAGLSGELKFILICLAAYLFTYNITSYFQTISQITKRFGEFSLRMIIQSIFTVIAIFVLWLIYKNNGNLQSYRIYTIIFVSINALLCLWYMFTYREIVFGKISSESKDWKQIKSIFLFGFPLMICNICSTLILSLDRQFVNVLFDIETYAVYAFAYNLLSLFSITLSAISTVLYPSLKRTDTTTLKEQYPIFISVILVILGFCLLLYFPLCLFIGWFLPKYVECLPIFRVILPGLAISSVITIVMQNYYKAEEKIVMLFIKTVVVLVISFAANLLVYYLFGTTISISIASVITISLWYIVMDEYFIRKYKTKWVKNYLFLIFFVAAFYLITMWNVWWAAMLVYFVSIILLTLSIYFSEAKSLYFHYISRKGKE